jgi:hypothetical protein
VDDRDRHGPERNDGPLSDADVPGRAVEGLRDLREVAGADQPLGTENELLSTPTQRDVCLVPEGNRDVREAVEEVDLVDVCGRPSALEIAV